MFAVGPPVFAPPHAQVKRGVQGLGKPGGPDVPKC